MISQYQIRFLLLVLINGIDSFSFLGSRESRAVVRYKRLWNEKCAIWSLYQGQNVAKRGSIITGKYRFMCTRLHR